MLGLRWIMDATRRRDGSLCINIRPRVASDRNWLNITRGEGCYSSVGMAYLAGAQELSIGPRCSTPAVVAHEHIHALGIE